MDRIDVDNWPNGKPDNGKRTAEWKAYRMARVLNGANIAPMNIGLYTSPQRDYYAITFATTSDADKGYALMKLLGMRGRCVRGCCLTCSRPDLLAK